MANEQTKNPTLPKNIVWEKIRESLEALEDVSQRGWVILGAASLDENLAALLSPDYS